MRLSVPAWIALWLLPLCTARAELAIPDFLPACYADVLTLGDDRLQRVSTKPAHGMQRAAFATSSRAKELTIEQLDCDRIYCDVFYEKQLKERNAELRPLAGQFILATATEFAIEWRSRSQRHQVVVTKLPRKVMVWTVTLKAPGRFDDERWRTRLFVATDQQRYQDALLLGSVEVGRWAVHGQKHAHDLLGRGRADDAVAVLKQVVTWSPYLFEAQIALAENTQDDATARASALAVWENAESAELTGRAGRLLLLPEATWQSLPVIDSNERGLQIVLLPLQPCDVRLVGEAGKLLSRILDVAVHVARLPDEWHWGAPDRLYLQRDVQAVLQQRAAKSADFAGWTPKRYTDELLKAVAKDDALTKFQVASFSKDLSTKPGQYLAGAPVLRLFQMIHAVRSGDRRTMYIGVTEADIYTGEVNFNFTSGWRQGDLAAAITSYARMKATSTNEQYESRKRLIERLAKELVPAALQQLGIPRPVDPADPYSYSDGVERLSQKTLSLSPPTRAALDKFRGP